MCKFRFGFNTVRFVSLEIESEVLPSGKDFRKKTSAVHSGIFRGALLWLYLGFILRCLFVCIVYLYLFVFMDTP